jgi:hypothetical protein
MQLDAPSLDDVFADATGRRLEGASGEGAGDDVEAAPGEGEGAPARPAVE